MTHQQARFMHEHISKRVKMQTKPTGAQTSMVSISLHGAEKGKGMHEATDIMAMHPKWLHPNKASWVSDVTTTPRLTKGVKYGKA